MAKKRKRKSQTQVLKEVRESRLKLELQLSQSNARILSLEVADANKDKTIKAMQAALLEGGHKNAMLTLSLDDSQQMTGKLLMQLKEHQKTVSLNNQDVDAPMRGWSGTINAELKKNG